jgi:hypothetical protein
MQKCSGLDVVARGARKARGLMVLLAGNLPVERSVETAAKRTPAQLSRSAMSFLARSTYTESRCCGVFLNSGGSRSASQFP